MRYWRSLVQACISVVLLLSLFLFVDWRQGINFLADANPLLMLASLFLYPVGLLIGAWRWRFFLRPFGLRPSLGKVFSSYWVGAFVSNFLPSNIGGDLSRIYIFKNYQMTAQVTASVIAERASGAFVAISLASAGLFLLADGMNLPPSFGWISFSFPAFMMFVLVATFWKGSEILLTLEAFFDGRVNAFAQVFNKIHKLHQSLAFYRRHGGSLLRGVFCSAVYYLFVFFTHYVLLRAIGVDFSFSKIIFIVPWINLISMIPVSMNAYGLAEGAFVYFYSNAGLLPAQALALALAARLIQITGSSLGVIFILINKGRK